MSRYVEQHFQAKTLDRMIAGFSTSFRGCAAVEVSGSEMARVEGTLFGGYALKHRALQDLEEALPRMKAEGQKKAASSHKASGGARAEISSQSAAGLQGGNVWAHCTQLPTLIRWWEWLRAPVVHERKTRSRKQRRNRQDRVGSFAGNGTVQLQRRRVDQGTFTLVVFETNAINTWYVPGRCILVSRSEFFENSRVLISPAKRAL